MNGAGRVLIVDDDADTRYLLAKACETANYVVREAATGRQAVARLNAEPFDVVLLDLGLPDVDGVELLDEIAVNHENLIAIIVTAHPTQESAIAAVRRGAADYLIKPLVLREVLQIIAGKLLERARRQQRLLALEAFGNEILGDNSQTSPKERNSQPHENNSQSSDMELPLQLNPATQEVRISGQKPQRIILTKGETVVLDVMLQNAGVVLSYQDLAYEAWGEQLERDHAASIIRPLIFRLRRKLEPDPSMPSWIRTVRGVGYTFIPR